MSRSGADLFTESAQRVVDYLTRRTALPNWSVSRVSAGEQVHLHVRAEDYLRTGQRVAWGDTFCRRMTAGAADVVTDSTQDPDYSDLPDVPTIRAYAGTPLRGDEGELFGILCGVGDEPLASTDEVDGDLVRLFGSLLSAQLTASRHHDEVTREAELARAAAETDALTGLLNRRGWEIVCAEAQTRVEAYGDLAAVVVIDLDGLKLVNDRDGHAAGDALITRAAAVLREAFRDQDQVARYGGDEFVALLNGVDPDRLQARVSQLVDRLEAAGVAASVGSEVAQAGRRGVEETFMLADAAMYRQKRERRSAAPHLTSAEDA